MRVIKNINLANVCTLLGNKGADRLCAALDSLTKKDEKNIANYLVVPNNFVLSLSLSLSHIGQAYSPHFFLLAYAREACRATPVNKGLFGVSFALFFVITLYGIKN